MTRMTTDHTTLRRQLFAARRKGELVEIGHVDGRDLCGYEIIDIGQDWVEVECEELEHTERVAFRDIDDIGFV